MPTTRCRLFVGRIHPATRERDIERFFKGYGRIRDIMMKRGYCFVELDDERDAEDAVYELTGKDIMGERVSVEFAKGTPHGRDRIGWVDDRGGRRGVERYRVLQTLGELR